MKITKKTYGGFLVSRLKQLGGRVFERLLRENGVDAFNGPQGRILYVLWEHGQMNITEIGRLTSLAKTTLTSMLDRMEEAGLIQRISSKSNRRQILIALTERAKSLSQDYEKVSDQMNAIYYKGFSNNEIRLFESSLKRIIANLEQQEKL